MESAERALQYKAPIVSIRVIAAVIEREGQLLVRSCPAHNTLDHGADISVEIETAASVSA
jgi:hypothetical protein